MKIKSLLEKAALCATEDDARTFLDEVFTPAFKSTSALGQFWPANAESYMEGANLFARFELNHEISDHYITMIRPEIRDKKFVLVVATNHMLDGAGMSSQSWEIEEGMDDLIEPSESATVASVASQAKSQAIANHRELIERVGVPRKVAEVAAKKSW